MLVLKRRETKLLLAGWCWRLVLKYCETKLLLAGAGAEQSVRKTKSTPLTTNSTWCLESALQKGAREVFDLVSSRLVSCDAPVARAPSETSVSGRAMLCLLQLTKRVGSSAYLRC